MNDKKGIMIGIIVAGVVILTLAFYLLNIRNIEIRDVVEICIVFVLVAFATYILWDKLRNVQKGLPAKDERVSTVNYKAGYYGFIAAIWTVVFSNVAVDVLFSHELTGSELAGVTVIVSGFVFALAYLYLSRKGT
jgi:hypothetical protein